MQFIPGCCHCSTGVTGAVGGCNGLALSGATIAFKQSGTTIYTFMSDGSGNWSGSIAAGTYDRVVTEGSGRFLTRTTTGVVVSGVSQSFTDGLTNASGYHCCANVGGAYPLADSFPINDSLFGGPHTMTFQFFGGVGSGWAVTYNGFAAQLLQNTGVFSYGGGTHPLTSGNTPPPPFAFVWSQASPARTWTASGA